MSSVRKRNIDCGFWQIEPGLVRRISELAVDFKEGNAGGGRAR